jgi:hypothetical protein
MDNWPAIDRFARDLLERGELVGRELQAKLTAACRLVKNRVHRETLAKSPVCVGKVRGRSPTLAT